MCLIQSCMRMLGAGLLVAVSGVGLFAQTPAPDSTQQVGSFSVESTVPLAAIQSTLTPNIPANIAASISGGALEIRQRVQLVASNPPGSNPTLRVSAFLVAPGSPAQTPAVAQAQSPLFSFTVRVENIIISRGKRPAVTFIGTVTSNDQTSPFGDLVGTTVIVSTGYAASGTTTTFSDLVVLAPGIGTLYSRTASGTLVLQTATPGTGGTAGNRSPVVVAGPQGIVTTAPEVQLDASASTDPDGDTLTFSWRVVGRTASIIDANTATPRVQFSEGFGEYTFEVTVSDGKGGVATGTVVVSYLGR